MPSTYWPAVEARKRYVDLFLADATLVGVTHGTPGALLFPAHSPKHGAADLRVYGSRVLLPEDPDVREALPRVLVETWGALHDREQRDVTAPAPSTGLILDGPVNMRVHVVVAPEDEAVGERILAHVGRLILSTQASNARMIAAEFVPDGDSTAEQIAFRDAWDLVSRWRSQNVGALT